MCFTEKDHRLAKGKRHVTTNAVNAWLVRASWLQLLAALLLVATRFADVIQAQVSIPGGGVDARSTASPPDKNRRAENGLRKTPVGEAVAVSEWQRTTRLMRGIQRRMQAFDAAEQTLREQHEVVRQLDAWIKRLESSAEANSAASMSDDESQATGSADSDNGQPPGSGQQATSDAPLQSSPNDAGAGSESPDNSSQDPLFDRAWGHLPAATRQLIRASRPERFLPKYSRLIEDYYRRLAESPRDDAESP